MMSGFLITASYERNANLKQYALNRILRIYPALWIAFIITTVVIFNAGYLHVQNLREFFFWAFCQTGVLQFYNPSFLREFGVGVVNGSLWTISVELQFYAIVPLLYIFMRKCSYKVKFYWSFYVIAVCISYFFTQIPNVDQHISIHDRGSIYLIILKLSKLTLLPYLLEVTH